MGLSQYTRGAKVTGSAAYFGAGFMGRLEVKECKIVNQESNTKEPGFAVSFIVKESNGVDPVGSERGIYISLAKDKFIESNMGDILRTIGVIIGFDRNNKESIEYYVTSELQDKVTGRENILKGYLVDLEVGQPKEGGTFTRKYFSPVAPEEQPEGLVDWQAHTGL
jgi:hypothetical protein